MTTGTTHLYSSVLFTLLIPNSLFHFHINLSVYIYTFSSHEYSLCKGTVGLNRHKAHSLLIESFISVSNYYILVLPEAMNALSIMKDGWRISLKASASMIQHNIPPWYRAERLFILYAMEGLLSSAIYLTNGEVNSSCHECLINKGWQERFPIFLGPYRLRLVVPPTDTKSRNLNVMVVTLTLENMTCTWIW